MVEKTSQSDFGWSVDRPDSDLNISSHGPDRSGLDRMSRPTGVKAIGGITMGLTDESMRVINRRFE